MAKVSLDHVTRDFNGFLAVKDLTFEVEDGSIVAFLGPSGCGKTTTLRMVAGLDRPTSGRILVDDVDVTNKSASERNIGMVFQFAVVYNSMNVFRNIAIPLKSMKYPKSEIDRRVNEVASLLKLEPYLNEKPRELNAALRQRIAIARAMVKPRSVYILDEPLTNLDMMDRVQLRGELKRSVRMLKQTVIFVTHDQTEAMSIADKIMVMNKGEMQQYDTCQNIYSNPASRFVGWFIGSPAMNFLDCTFAPDRGTVEVGPLSFHAKEDVAAELRQCSEHAVTLGIRPEDISIGKASHSTFEADVVATELSGNRIVATLKSTTGEWDLIGKFPLGTAIARRQKVWISLPSDKVKIFNRKTERLIA